MQFIDRKAKYPGRWTMKKSDGTSEVVTLIRNDEPTVEGTPMNAATLNELSDVAGADVARAQAEAARDAAKSSQTAAASSASAAKTSETNAAESASSAAADLKEIEDGLASGAFKGEKGDPGSASVAIDDSKCDLVTTWSSKYIVDMLCAPIEETGNSVQCYPVTNYPLGVTAEWEPTQEGTGDPSPENIRPISGRNSVTVTRCGENLIDQSALASFWSGSLTYENGVVTVKKATSSIFSNHLPLNLPTNATIHATPIAIANSATNGRLTFEFADKSTQALYLTDNNGSVKDTSYSITLRKPAIACFLDYSTFGSGFAFKELTATCGEKKDYTPYTGQTNTITFESVISGRNLDVVTGKGQKTWGLLTLNGTEVYDNQNGSYDNDETVMIALSLDKNSSEGITRGGILCTHLKNITTGNSAQSSSVNYECIGRNSSSMYSYAVYLRVKKSRVGATSSSLTSNEKRDKVKAWIASQYAAGTPVQIAYELAASESFTATGAQPIPALSGVNTVLTDADSVTVTGRADPIKRITDLEDAVASMTTNE